VDIILDVKAFVDIIRDILDFVSTILLVDDVSVMILDTVFKICLNGINMASA